MQRSSHHTLALFRRVRIFAGLSVGASSTWVQKDLVAVGSWPRPGESPASVASRVVHTDHGNRRKDVVPMASQTMVPMASQTVVPKASQTVVPMASQTVVPMTSQAVVPRASQTVVPVSDQTIDWRWSHSAVAEYDFVFVNSLGAVMEYPRAKRWATMGLSISKLARTTRGFWMNGRVGLPPWSAAWLRH